MSTENQPITVLSVYTTFAWVQPIGSGGSSLAITDARYLQKTVPDTATALETFDAGIKTNSITCLRRKFNTTRFYCSYFKRS